MLTIGCQSNALSPVHAIHAKVHCRKMRLESPDRLNSPDNGAVEVFYTVVNTLLMAELRELACSVTTNIGLLALHPSLTI